MELLHPKLVHLPIALAVLMPLVGAGLLLAWWREWLPRRVWLVAVLMQATLVVSGFAAMQTGEADEERVETVVAEAAIEAHEEAAELFVWAAAGTLLPFLLGAALRRERWARAAAFVAVVGTVGVLGAGYRVGEAGGALVYEHGAASAWIGAAGASTGVDERARPRHDDDDDD